MTGGVDGQGPGLFKIPVGGGAPVRLVSRPALNPVWSPDGTVIIYSGTVVAASAPLLAVRPDGGPVDLPAVRVRTGGERYRFLPDGKRLIYMQGESASQNFWLLDLDARTRRPLTRLVNVGGTAGSRSGTSDWGNTH